MGWKRLQATNLRLFYFQSLTIGEISKNTVYFFTKLCYNIQEYTYLERKMRYADYSYEGRRRS